MSNVSVTITEENNTVTISQPGPVGPQGAGITTYTDTTDDNVDPGHVIYKKGNGNVAKLVANGSVVPRVAGIVITGSVQSGGAQYRMEGLVDIADWSAFTDEGNAGLSEGNFYYVSPSNAGKITASAPTTVGQYVVQVGYAQSSTQLNLLIQPPIKL